jgi:hypothetical protein
MTQPHYSSANRGGGAAEGFGRAAEGGGSAGGTLPGLSDNGASKLYEPPQHQHQQQQGGFGMAAAGSVSPYGQHATGHGEKHVLCRPYGDVAVTQSNNFSIVVHQFGSQ